MSAEETFLEMETSPVGIYSPVDLGERNPVHWRLIVDGAHSAAWNMAMDGALLDAVCDGIAPPTVRIYTWDEPAVTVGRNQDVEGGVDMEFCDANAIPVVRRPTGGRGILHGSDLTVSTALPLEALPANQRSVISSYRYLSRGIVQALLALGFDGAMGECDRRSGPTGDCFSVRSRADVVTVAGQKLVGSAQRRSGAHLLQQSSIRCRRPEVPPERVFRGPVEPGTYPLQYVPEARLICAVVQGFSQLFAAGPERTSGPSAWEEERCGVLITGSRPMVFTPGKGPATSPHAC